MPFASAWHWLVKSVDECKFSKELEICFGLFSLELFSFPFPYRLPMLIPTWGKPRHGTLQRWLYPQTKDFLLQEKFWLWFNLLRWNQGFRHSNKVPLLVDAPFSLLAPSIHHRGHLHILPQCQWWQDTWPHARESHPWGPLSSFPWKVWTQTQIWHDQAIRLRHVPWRRSTSVLHLAAKAPSISNR